MIGIGLQLVRRAFLLSLSNNMPLRGVEVEIEEVLKACRTSQDHVFLLSRNEQVEIEMMRMSL